MGDSITKAGTGATDALAMDMSVAWEDICEGLWDGGWTEDCTWSRFSALSSYLDDAMDDGSFDAYGDKLWGELSAGHLSLADAFSKLDGIGEDSPACREVSRRLRDIRDIWTAASSRYESSARKTGRAPSGPRSKEDVRRWVAGVRSDLCLKPVLDAYFDGAPVDGLLRPIELQPPTFPDR